MSAVMRECRRCRWLWDGRTVHGDATDRTHCNLCADEDARAGRTASEGERLTIVRALRQGACDNAYALGACDEADRNYRRDEVFGGDRELGREYDLGFANSESQSLDDFMDGADGYSTSRFVGVFCRGATHDGTSEGARAAHEFVCGGAA